MNNNDDKAWPIALTKCYYCGESSDIYIWQTNTVSTRREMRAAHGGTISMSPCSKCEQWMKDGIILITIDPAKSLDKDGYIIKESNGMPNPYRTGGFFVIKEQAFVELMGVSVQNDEIREFALAHRFMFIEHEAAVKIGLFAMAEAQAEINQGGKDDTDRSSDRPEQGN